jgi:hypothetical protein
MGVILNRSVQIIAEDRSDLTCRATSFFCLRVPRTVPPQRKCAFSFSGMYCWIKFQAWVLG